MAEAPYTVLLFSAATDPERWQQAVRIRYEVFVEEQGVPISEELDQHDTGDPTCVHAMVESNGVALATGRIYEPSSGVGKIGRMAVLPKYRGQKSGTAILDALIMEARRRGLREVVLDAQVQAREFYARKGFSSEGGIFLDCGIPHQLMRLVL